MNKIEVSLEEDAPGGSRGVPYAEQENQAIRDINQELILACIRQQELAEAAATAERRLQEVNAALEAALARERHITEVLQRPLMLEVAEHAFAGLSVATLYKAALEEAQVGGDFFDAFALPHGKVALALADASGKGLAAAVRTLQAKDVLRAFAREYPQAPTAIVSRLNNFVCDTRRFDDQGGESFLTLALVVLDPATGEGTLVSAGCEPPLVLRADGVVEVLEASGLPLGVESEELYTAVPFHLAPHDTLLMVTDGITEARRGGAFLGYDGMIEIARDALTSATSLRQMGQNMLDRARSFAGGSLQDDACLLLARRIQSDTTEPALLRQRSEQENQEIRDVNQELILSCIRQQEMAEAATAAERQLQEANAALEALAARDGLTGLVNHRVFQERLEAAFQQARRYNEPLSLLLLDVDNFKAYNDAYGHPAGDEVLKTVARLLQQQARTSDLVARYGGEEFAIVLPHTDSDGAMALGERFRVAIEAAAWDGQAGAVTVSVGVATLIPATARRSDLVAAADGALYDAKKDGRNRVATRTS